VRCPAQETLHSTLFMGPAYVPILMQILWEAYCLNRRASFCLYENVVFTTESESEQAVGSCGKECLGKSNGLINGERGCPIKINSNLMDGFDFRGTRDRLNSFAEEWSVLRWIQHAWDVPSRSQITVCRTFFRLESKFPKATNSDASFVIWFRFVFL